MFGGLRLAAGPRVGVPDAGHRQTSCCSGRGSAHEILPYCVGRLVRLYLASPPHLRVALFSLAAEEAVQLVFSSYAVGVIS